MEYMKKQKALTVKAARQSITLRTYTSMEHEARTSFVDKLWVRCTAGTRNYPPNPSVLSVPLTESKPGQFRGMPVANTAAGVLADVILRCMTAHVDPLSIGAAGLGAACLAYDTMSASAAAGTGPSHLLGFQPHVAALPQPRPNVKGPQVPFEFALTARQKESFLVHTSHEKWESLFSAVLTGFYFTELLGCKTLGRARDAERTEPDGDRDLDVMCLGLMAFKALTNIRQFNVAGKMERVLLNEDRLLPAQVHEKLAGILEEHHTPVGSLLTSAASAEFMCRADCLAVTSVLPKYLLLSLDTDLNALIAVSHGMQALGISAKSTVTLVLSAAAVQVGALTLLNGGSLWTVKNGLCQPIGLSFIAGGSAGFLGGLVQKEENEKKGILRVCSSMLKSSLIQIGLQKLGLAVAAPVHKARIVGLLGGYLAGLVGCVIRVKQRSANARVECEVLQTE